MRFKLFAQIINYFEVLLLSSFYTILHKYYTIIYHRVFEILDIHHSSWSRIRGLLVHYYNINEQLVFALESNYFIYFWVIDFVI